MIQSMPIYLLSAMSTTKGNFRILNQIFARFFWGSSGSEKRRHWAAWDTICLPIEEGDLGLRSLSDVNKAMMAKLWWKFRTDISTLWGMYMDKKYCKKYHPIFAPSTGASNV